VGCARDQNKRHLKNKGFGPLFLQTAAIIPGSFTFEGTSEKIDTWP